MKNRKVVFANQKGGVGKSTLCILFANYLAAKGKSVCIIDTDLQKTILMQRRKDKQLYEGEEEPYNVQDFDVTDVETMQKLVDSASQVDGFVLFDSPGNISEDGLAPLFVGADYIVCPYEYEDKALDSTGVFVQVLNVLREHNPQMTAQLFFVPNRIDPRIGTADEQRCGAGRTRCSETSGRSHRSSTAAPRLSVRIPTSCSAHSATPSKKHSNTC